MATRFEGNRFEHLARRALRSVESGLSQAKNLRIFVRSEMKHAKETPFPTKVAMWRRGFHSTSGAKYSLALRPHRDCVPDLPYVLRGESVNGEYRVLLNDKLAFYHLLRGFHGLMPKHFALLRRGRLLPMGDAREVPATLSELVEQHGPLVLKPCRGTASRGLTFVDREGSGFLVNGEARRAQELDAEGRALDGYFASEKVVPHPWLREVAPRTTNCLRLLTLWDDETDAPFIAAACITLGTRDTYPTDIKGLNTPIDLATGRLGTARRWDGTYHERHTDTDRPFTGESLPHFELACRRTLEVCREFPFLRQIGWDIAITEDGVKVIEGNNHPSLARHQVHAPMLQDPRVRRFYQRAGLVR